MSLPLLLALAALATPAAAQRAEVAEAQAPAGDQRLGQRTQAPETMVSGLSLAPGEDDLQPAIAEAETHPLGTLANPIRVGGPDGERAYLARLRCGDGAAPRVGPRRDGGVDTYGTVTGTYRLECPAGPAEIFFDIYHEEHVEDRAPAGMTLRPR